MTAYSTQPGPPTAARFRERLQALFADAAAAGDVIERRYAIAGSSVLLRFAGAPMLERLAPAFSHLEASDTEPPTLSVDVWDSASSGTEEPPPLGDPVEEVGPDNGYSGPVYYYEADGFQALARRRTLAALDHASAAGWFWAPAPEQMLSWDWAYPLRPIVDWWLHGHGMLLAHGGAVGVPEGGVLIAGPGGSGKSTATLASVGSELRYLGDDLVGVGVAPSPRLYSVYSSGKLADGHLARFPRLAGAAANPERGAAEKAVAYIHERFPGATLTDVPLRAIVIPRVGRGIEPRLIRVSPGAALTALAPSTILQGLPHRPSDLTLMRGLVRAVPSYRLELGSALDQVPQVLLGLVRD